MTKLVAFQPGQPAAANQLADVLTSPDERVRCLGRAFASGVGEVLQSWLEAELNRGTDSILLLETVATLGAQHVASVAAAVLKPSGDAVVTTLVREIAERKLPGYIAAVRAARGVQK